jgi:hypothetical protein
MVRPIRPFSCLGADPTFQQRDTAGSERSEETVWARVCETCSHPVHTSQVLSYQRPLRPLRHLRHLRVKLLMS